ncbi:MAG TPA: DUF1847 domain-containing protein [Selenomonadales bacterium]|mgnify:CR=1 FL=1|nr:DUF1847 domain-containing protein [Selenomonadales bacterium]
MEQEGKCALCAVQNRICQRQGGTGPKFCSTALYGDALEQARAEYAKSEVGEFARQAAIQEAECYAGRDVSPGYYHPAKPRLQEIMEFARRMGYRKLGVAFCGGLHQEAAVFCKILTDNGFDVVSAMCKVGGVDKSAIGVEENEKVRPCSFEPMCNPIGQALVLNEAKTQFNILVGLCVGHDSLFLKYAEAPVTVFAVKDRVLGHNPLAAIYTCDSYYRRFKQGQLKEITVKEANERRGD